MNLESPLFLMANYKLFSNKREKFFALDTQELYNYHLKEFGSDWKYAKKEIIYKTNSLSYRTKELDFFVDKEFILVLGCSHTFGTGLAENEIYHSFLGKKINLKILNGGYGAIGPDMILSNSFLFLKNSNLRPKAVVIQWPELNRFTFKGTSNFVNMLPEMFAKNNSNRMSIFSEFLNNFESNKNSKILKFYKSWVDDENSTNHSSIFIEITRLLWKLYGVPYFDFTLQAPKDIPNNINIKSFHYLIKDLARDQLHYGCKTHKDISLEIFNNLKNNLVVL